MSNTQAKRTYKKYVKIVRFTIEELNKVIAAHPNGGFITLDYENESSNAKMQEHKIRYIGVMCKGSDGKFRQLHLDFPLIRIISRMSTGKTDEGKIPSSIMFSAINKLTGEYKTNVEFESAISELAEQFVTEGNPELKNKDLAAYEQKVKSQKFIYKTEHSQFKVLTAINDDFVRYMSMPETKKKLTYFKESKGFIQRERKYDPVNDKDSIPDDKGMLPLKDHIFRFRIKIDRREGKQGHLAANMYELTAAGSTKLKIEGKDPDVNNIQGWFRPTSVVGGILKFEYCMTSQSSTLHAVVTELNIRRAAARSFNASKLDKASLDQLINLDDGFDNGQEETPEPELDQRTKDLDKAFMDAVDI